MAKRLPYDVPSAQIYRIARAPDPWAPLDWAYVGDDGTFSNRFDDSEGYFRVLYASSSPLGCFVETLARYRTAPYVQDLITALANIENADDSEVKFGTVPLSWLRTRALGVAKTTPQARFADIYSAEWLSYLRGRFEPAFKQRHPGVQEFDLSQLMSQDRKLTQQIASVVYQLGYEGISYQSRHGRELQNWALFEPFPLVKPSATAILQDNVDFHNALSLLGLSLDTAL